MAAPGIRHRLLALTTALTAALMTASAAEAAVPPAWTSVAPMGEARYSHVAVPLPDGDVLVAGGAGLATAERFDFGTETWSPTGSMATARTGAAAVALPDGRVLVTGGVFPSSNSAEIYDPATDSWASAAPMGAARSELALTALPDGRVLAVGGENGGGQIASAEIYDPATDSWAPTGSLATPRSRHTATLLGDGTVLVVGGLSGGATVAMPERFDPAAGLWAPAAPLSTARFGHTATLLRDGTVLVAGGASGNAYTSRSERYAPDRDAWEFGGTMADPALTGGATLLPNGSVLATGGNDQVAEVYDPKAGNWLPAGSAAGHHSAHSSTPLPDGTVLLAGGTLFNIGTTDADRFELVTAASAPAAELGKQSVDRTATAIVPVRNDGYAPLFVTGAAFAGPAAADFAVRHDGCSTGGAIARREICFVLVAFEPQAAGPRVATLVLEANTPSGRIEIAGTGTGIAQPRPPASARTAAPPALRCVKGRAGRMVCSGLARATRARRASVRLVRGGKVFAVGRVDARGKLRLKPRRTVLLRRYNLRIAGTDKRRMVVEIVSFGR